MKTIRLDVSILFVLCIALVGCSQSAPSAPSTSAVTAKPSEDPVLLPVKVSGKWGYVNGSGQMLINPQFDNAEDFHEGRAVVCLGKPCSWWESSGDSLYGYIDTSGKVVVTPQYQSASGFSEGLASVCKGQCSGQDTTSSSRGYIDRDGKLVIPMQFGIAASFSEGMAQVCVGTCQWEKDRGYSGKFGFIDHSGHFTINPQYDNVGDFKNGFASVTLGKGNDAKSGYVDKTGKVIWQPSN